MNSKSLIKEVERNGWRRVRTKGSHVQFKHDDYPEILTIPHPKKDLPIGTVKQIKKIAKLQVIQSTLRYIEMKYAIAVHKDTDSCYGVTIPDVPGCFSHGDTLDEAIENAREALTLHFEALAEDGQTIPLAQSIDKHINDPDFKGVVWFVIDANPRAYMGKAKRINISLPTFAIQKIDHYVETHPEFKDRSNFLLNAALDAVEKDSAEMSPSGG